MRRHYPGGGEPNVMLMPGSSFRRLADNLYASYGLTPNNAYQFEATRTGLVCVAHNGAVMVTTDHMIFNSFQENKVVPLSIGLAVLKSSGMQDKYEIDPNIDLSKTWKCTFCFS